MKNKENLTGYAFVLPALLIFLILLALPLLFSIFLSFTKWNFFSGFDNIKWIGLQNYEKLLKDSRFINGIINTFIYCIAVVPVSILGGLALANLLNTKVYMKGAMRLFLFIPYISSSVALAAVFKAIFREDGIVNTMLMSWFGMKQSILWFSDPTFTKIPIILFSIWVQLGFCLIIYMAALQNVPKDIYESASLDGSTPWNTFWKITVPMISPTTFYLIIVEFIAVFKIFDAIDIMNFGNYMSSNTSLVLEIYQNAFGNYKFGYASAEAVVLLLFIALVTAVNFIMQKKWVNY